MNWFYNQSETDKNKAQKISVENHIKSELDIILIEGEKDCKDFDPENLIQFKYLSFFIYLFLTIYLLK